MLQLRIRYQIQAFCGYKAEEGVAKGVATKIENASVVIFDAGSENVAIVQKGSGNVAIGKGNVAIVETGNVAIEIGNAVIEGESIETQENAVKKNVSGVKGPEQT